MENAANPTAEILDPRFLIQVFEQAHQGICRCEAFLDIYDNKISADKIKKEDLENFLQWNRNNVFRELIESFAFFLTELRCAIELIKVGELTSEREKIFRNDSRNFHKQLEEVRKNINISKEDGDFLLVMNDLSNCISHDCGLAIKDKLEKWGRDGKIKFPRISPMFQDSSGKWIEATPPCTLPENTGLSVGIIYEEKQFKEFEEIKFESKQISDICTAMHLLLDTKIAPAVDEFFKTVISKTNSSS